MFPPRMLLCLIPCKMSTKLHPGQPCSQPVEGTLIHSRHTRSIHISFYRALIIFSQHSPLRELGPTQEGAAELLHIAHVNIVEVVPCLGRDTEKWDVILHSHQVHCWDQPSAPDLSQTQPVSDACYKTQGPRVKLPIDTEQSPFQDQCIMTSKLRSNSQLWPHQLGRGGFGHVTNTASCLLLVSSLPQSFLLLALLLLYKLISALLQRGETAQLPPLQKSPTASTHWRSQVEPRLV